MSGPCDISRILLSNRVGYIEFTTCFGYYAWLVSMQGIMVMLQNKISEKDMRIFYTTSAHVILMHRKLLMSKRGRVESDHADHTTVSFANALETSMNSARRAMPFSVPSRLSSARSSLCCPKTCRNHSYCLHSRSMWLRVWHASLHGHSTDSVCTKREQYQCCHGPVLVRFGCRMTEPEPHQDHLDINILNQNRTTWFSSELVQFSLKPVPNRTLFFKLANLPCNRTRLCV